MALELCANAAALRTYMRTVDQEERRLTAIENRAAALMLTDCSNSRTEMVTEALAEMNEATGEAIAIHMAGISNKRCAVDKARHYEMIGRMIAGAIDNYCAREATRMAENEIAEVSCSHCYDAGCRFCNEAA